MENTLGKRIAALRREKGMKQDELAEKMQVSPQAVSKWENDQTCPDISVLPTLAKLFGISVDELLTGKKEAETRVVSLDDDAEHKNKVIHLEITDGGDKIRLNFPIEFVRGLVQMGMSLPGIVENDNFRNVDLEQIITLVDKGLVGTILEIEGEDKERIRIYVD
ncbi:MAG: helix-turn-helix transcriptional regulator [Clostridia bacterium]|nr:helix-turn-helix transcriptional regulator [Clostridia bacterium]